ncbi:MAG: SMP-30/gluconolactonase/LRE family protein [Immundisolibacteraceae bacterium]|nr:SMP-30/gluconolactonase/LRE family protein [Immundisolibacteraceae bacterium]
MKNLSAELFVDGLVFGEGPRWHNEHLYVSDMFAHQLLRIDMQGNKTVIAKVPGRPSGSGFLANGSQLLVSMVDRRILKLSGNDVSEVANLNALTNADLNDMVVNANGDAYVGGFGFDLFGGAEPAMGNIVLLPRDGSPPRVVADDLDFPNGMVITPDGKRLISAETFGHQLMQYDIGADGSLLNRREFAALGDYTPDGICQDAEGAIWIASFVTDEFVRVKEGGEITHRVDPGRPAVACMLGGPDRKTLFMISAETDIEQLAQGNSKAFIETVQVDVPGAGIP